MFTLASLGAGLAGSGAVLIAARLVHGLGAALMVPTTLAIIVATFDDRRERTPLLLTFVTYPEPLPPFPISPSGSPWGGGEIGNGGSGDSTTKPAGWLGNGIRSIPTLAARCIRHMWGQ